jgi:uncharacterized membrane protein
MDNQKIKAAAINFFQKEWHELSEIEKRVVQSVAEKRKISRDLNRTFNDERTFGERLADRVASFGGSWTFIIIFGFILLVWIILNSFVLVRYSDNFDPYPYILLNLFLSMLAALQAPVIMMSQNRQAAKDRLDAQHDYEVNLKAELEIMHLHQKIDDLRDRVLTDLLEMQKEQTALLNQIKTQIALTDQ